jgi:cell wall-associated NlpC family hydrolase
VNCTVKARLACKAAVTAALLLALAGVAGGCGWGHSSRLGAAAAKESRRYLGVPYRPGGEDPLGFDCSGLTYFVYHRLGLELPRSAATQAAVGRKVRQNRLRAGDLVFFATGPGREVTHVGIYLGGWKFIHAPGQGKTVIISRLDSDYYARKYHSARRVS